MGTTKESQLYYEWHGIVKRLLRIVVAVMALLFFAPSITAKASEEYEIGELFKSGNVNTEYALSIT